MKIAFTGTRNIQDTDFPVVSRVLKGLITSDVRLLCITGGCVGTDALVAELGHRVGFAVFTVLPANHLRVDPLWEQHCDIYEKMPVGTSHRDRNTRMVELCDKLIAFPEYAENDARSRRSGTWMTVRIARKAGKPVEIHQLVR